MKRPFPKWRTLLGLAAIVGLVLAWDNFTYGLAMKTPLSGAGELIALDSFGMADDTVDPLLPSCLDVSDDIEKYRDATLTMAASPQIAECLPGVRVVDGPPPRCWPVWDIQYLTRPFPFSPWRWHQVLYVLGDPTRIAQVATRVSEPKNWWNAAIWARAYGADRDDHLFAVPVDVSSKVCDGYGVIAVDDK